MATEGERERERESLTRTHTPHFDRRIDGILMALNGIPPLPLSKSHWQNLLRKKSMAQVESGEVIRAGVGRKENFYAFGLFLLRSSVNTM